MKPIIPLLRPLLPSFKDLAPYLQRIDDARNYSNFGPLVRSLEERLADHLNVPAESVAVVANGTTALSAALLAVDAQKGKKCLVPSWTFVASAAAACAANLVPHFVDVTEETWMPDPHALRTRPDLDDVGAVMIVAPFGTPYDTRVWDEFSDDTGIPVVIDGAACFDTAKTKTESQTLRSTVMISLHATKVLGTGEGGLVASTDEKIMRKVRQVCNFGIWGTPDDQILGYNGKLSEYHAAIGLAALDQWPDRRAHLLGRTMRYIGELARLPKLRLLPRYGDGWVSTYCTVILEQDADEVGARLTATGVENRRWWRDGVHRFAAYRGFPHDELPITSSLAGRVLSLPFSHDISDAQIVRVVDELERALCD